MQRCARGGNDGRFAKHARMVYRSVAMATPHAVLVTSPARISRRCKTWWRKRRRSPGRYAVRVLASDAVRERLRKLGAEVASMPQPEFAALVSREIGASA